MSGFTFEEYKGHAVVRFESVLHEMSWGDVEKEASDVVEQIKGGNTSRILVDLSSMDLIQSGLVASLVRMWKATDGRPRRKVVVVAPHEVVQEVLRSAGLLKLFTVVSSRDEGLGKVGASEDWRQSLHEKGVVAFLALPAAILAAVAVFPVFVSNNPALGRNVELGGLLLAVLACMLSVGPVFREGGLRRGLGIIAMTLGLFVIGSLFLKDGSSQPPVVSPNNAGGPSEKLQEPSPEPPAPGPQTNVPGALLERGQPASPLSGEGMLTVRGRKLISQGEVDKSSAGTAGGNTGDTTVD